MYLNCRGNVYRDYNVSRDIHHILSFYRVSDFVSAMYCTYVDADYIYDIGWEYIELRMWNENMVSSKHGEINVAS